MITSNISSMSAVKAKVDIYNGTTLVQTCTCSDVLENFKISREGDTAKFFGYGICHKLDVTFIDLNRTMPQLTKGMKIVAMLGDGEEFDNPFPDFYITEVSRNEKTNSITCTAYDALYKAASITVQELKDELPPAYYSLSDVMVICQTLLGCAGVTDIGELDVEDLEYDEGANFTSDGNLRYVLDSLAEITQTIYYIDAGNNLVFKPFDKNGDAVLTIGKDDYYELDTQTVKTLTGVCNVTELGDNVELSYGEGITQYIRDNPFWDLRQDISDILAAALSRVSGLTIYQFHCDWAGDYRLEVGDKIGLVTEDNQVVHSYLLSDILEYNGSLSQITEWTYTEQENETASNPANIGEKINQTYAKVDKVNREITILTGLADDLTAEMAEIKVTTDAVTTTVSNVSSLVDQNTESYLTLSQEVSQKVSATDVEFIIEEELSNGVTTNSVTTSTGYKFDTDGLTVSKSDSDISTTITEDGMAVSKSNAEVLTANNQGVKAFNLEATTYLIIGNNSRFEDWNGGYTACFWIGG